MEFRLLLVALLVRSAVGSDGNILFDYPDITLPVRFHQSSAEVMLLAYKTKRTNQLLAAGGALSDQAVASLRWVTPGIPRFQLTGIVDEPRHLRLPIQYVDAEIRSRLAREIREQYGVDVRHRQILPIMFTRFVCVANLVGSANEDIFLEGEATDFNRDPLLLNFAAERRGPKRTALEHTLAANDSVTFVCDAYANGTLQRVSSLKIDFSQLGNWNLMEELFGDGPKTSAYVTRNQVARLAQDAYSRFSIEETYGMDEPRFSEAFIDDFVRFAGAHSFNQVPIETALSELSRYGWTSLAADIEPDVIVSDLGTLFNHTEVNNATRVVANREALDRFQYKYGSSSSDSDSGSASLKVFGLFEVGGSGSSSSSSSTNKETDEATERRSLDDQANYVASKYINDIRFKVEGRRVVPKSIRVAKLQRSYIEREMHFSRVRKVDYQAPFHQKYQIRLCSAACQAELDAPEVTRLTQQLSQCRERYANLLTQRRGEEDD